MVSKGFEVGWQVGSHFGGQFLRVIDESGRMSCVGIEPVTKSHWFTTSLRATTFPADVYFCPSADRLPISALSPASLVRSNRYNVLTWSVGPRVAAHDSQHVCRNFVSKETRTLSSVYEEAWVHSLPASEAIPLACQTLRCSGNIAEVWLVPARACS